MANKKPHSCWVFGFVGSFISLQKAEFRWQEKRVLKSDGTYKSNEKTSYLTTKLLKTVTVKVLESN